MPMISMRIIITRESRNVEDWADHARDALKVVAKSRGRTEISGEIDFARPIMLNAAAKMDPDRWCNNVILIGVMTVYYIICSVLKCVYCSVQIRQIF